MAAEFHFVLDVSAVIDLWLEERGSRYTEQLFDAQASGAARLWLAAPSIAAIDYVGRVAFKRRGMDPAAAAQVVPRLMEDLLTSVDVLSVHGFEQGEVYGKAEDYEDAQVASAARSLAGQRVFVVTENQGFDGLGEVTAIGPERAAALLTGGAPGLEEDTAQGPGTLLFIDLARQQAGLRPALERGTEAVFRHGKYIMGPEVQCLEARLAEYVGVEHCIGVASGTDALLVALMALGVSHGDEVITTPFSFIATAETIALLGAVAVFVDIDPRTYNLDPDLLEAAITPRTRAIMPVSLYGQCADFDAINAVAGRHGLPVIEDGAQSFGATYKGRRSCGLTTIGCTSFFPSKPLGGYGDGGACFTDDPDLATAMRQVRLHGQDRRYHHARVGINGRLDTLQAGILLAKLDAFPAEVEARGRIGAAYSERLQGLDCVTPFIEPHNTSVYAQYTLQVVDRQGLAEALKADGVPTAVHYPETLDHQPALEGRGRAQGDLAHARSAAERVISLPMHPYLDDATLDRVVAAVARHLG